MKIIVIYASAGAGHFKAAKAIHDYLKRSRPNDELELVDILDKSNLLFRVSYRKGYNLLVRYLIPLWDLSFRITSLKATKGLSRVLARMLNSAGTRPFAKFLIRENPDYVISTHFLSSEITSDLKKSAKIKSTLVTLITDFGAHPFWISENTDFYAVASEATKNELIQNGVSGEKIKVSGIPIEEKFLKHFDKNSLREKFGLAKKTFTVLIVTGSFGIGPIEEIVSLLEEQVQLLVVCARNKALYTKLKDKKYLGCFVFGFVDNVEELMAISDMIITKPGGLSISESLVMGLFPVFISPIPGQETENISALAQYGIGVCPKSLDSLKEIVLGFKQDPSKLEQVKALMEKLKKPDALEEINNVIR